MHARPGPAVTRRIAIDEGGEGCAPTAQLERRPSISRPAVKDSSLKRRENRKAIAQTLGSDCTVMA